MMQASGRQFDDVRTGAGSHGVLQAPAKSASQNRCGTGVSPVPGRRGGRPLQGFGAHSKRPTARGGFTLLETLIALVLMITMLAGVFGFYVSVLRARETGGQITRDALLANALLRRMADEIRHACDVVPGDGLGFSGTSNQLVIVRTKMPEPYAFDEYESIADNLPPGQEDLCRITYELIWDEEREDDEGVKICHGLLRSEQRTFDPNPKLVVKGQEDKPTATDGSDEEADKPGGGVMMPVDRELVAPEIKYVRFEYFDGVQWQDRWKQESAAVEGGGAMGGGRNDHALPQAVRITIGKKRVPPEDEELNITQLRKMDERTKKQQHHPDRFTIVVYLEQADQSLLSSRQFGNKNNPDLQTGGE